MAKQITLEQEIKELERELSMRRSVYPEWSKGPKPRLKPDTADHRIACLESTLARLKRMAPAKPEQASIF
ncbi:hypothetical protein FAES_1807 [Fibrella aestuarina BUZ 2]|uniref:50S ribosomal protein L29 n=1 Tax=Fibrella aestuarina BUZ 2 TaxID=1166018 RepID=I0K6R4_9BACT|nr:hypothetical protein [Fibrella aestuarina]CCG99817.1 hypothetical protein FAES_1807 [Fibrella aestuarina BUZ 2]